MIPLHVSSETKEEHLQWWEEHGVALEVHFKAYQTKDENGKRGKADWIPEDRKPELRRMVSGSSHGKCAYCERKPNDGGGYLELEHFLPKNVPDFQHLVFKLENLLPACKQCNTVKSSNTNQDGSEIINPFNEPDLRKHLRMDASSMELAGGSKLGKRTMVKLGNSLNTKKIPMEDGSEPTGALVPRVAGREEIDDLLKETVKMEPVAGVIGMLRVLLKK